MKEILVLVRGLILAVFLSFASAFVIVNSAKANACVTSILAWEELVIEIKDWCEPNAAIKYDCGFVNGKECPWKMYDFRDKCIQRLKDLYIEDLRNR